VSSRECRVLIVALQTPARRDRRIVDRVGDDAACSSRFSSNQAPTKRREPPREKRYEYNQSVSRALAASAGSKRISATFYRGLLNALERR
jgi:hypothetical protein